MKILFFIECLHSGGKERRLVELIKALSLRPGFTMELVLTKKDIHYNDIFNCNVTIKYAIRSNWFKKDPRVFLQFYNITRKFNPDLIHVWGNLVALYAIPTKLILKIPMINNQITDVPVKMNNSFIGSKTTFRYSDLVIANSKAGIDAYRAPNFKSKVVYNGFEFDRFKNLEDKIVIKKKFNITTDFVIGMVASFSVLKDYKTYIDAANIIIKEYPNTTFLCIGAGDDREYREMVDLDKKNKVLFLGRQEKVESIMNVCDIGVLTTYTEGISNALIEFSALEKPVIATEGGGTIELIENAKTGFLINQKSVEELVDKISFLIENNEKRIKLGRNGKKNIQENFSYEEMLEAYIEIYKQFENRR